MRYLIFALFLAGCTSARTLGTQQAVEARVHFMPKTAVAGVGMLCDDAPDVGDNYVVCFKDESARESYYAHGKTIQ